MTQLESLDTQTTGFNFGEHAFKQILLDAPVAVTITDVKGNILMINQSFSDITGYSDQELVGQNCSILSYNTTPQSVYENLWQTITSGKVWQGQLINRKKNGSLYIADMSISSLKNQEGDTFYYAIHKDITEKHQQQTHQKNQAAMFQAVLNSAPISIALINSESRVLFNNKKYERLTEFMELDPVALLSDLLQADYGYTSIQAFMKKEEYRNKSIHIEESAHSPERWFDFALARIPVTDTAAEAYFKPVDDYYVVVGIIDRTKEKRYLEEKRLSTVRLMTSDNKFIHSMQEAMMATLHQLQGPLNMIDSAVTILKQKNSACPGLIAMDEALVHASGALDDIKAAIPERTNEASQPVNLNQIVRDVVAIGTDQLLESSSNIDMHLLPTLGSITGKPYRLLLAIKQLFDNAIDAIQASNNDTRTIRITTEEVKGEISVTVEDSGKGINENSQLKVFQPFYSTKPKAISGCRGIGLSIVQQVINEHSATIKIESSQRLSGAKIKLIFPIYE